MKSEERLFLCCGPKTDLGPGPGLELTGAGISLVPTLCTPWWKIKVHGRHLQIAIE